MESESDLKTQLAVLEKLYVEQENKKQKSELKIKNESAAFDLEKKLKGKLPCSNRTKSSTTVS